MTFQVEDHPLARAEYIDAVLYYDQQRSGLGEELVTRVEEAINDILTSPTSWPVVPGSGGEHPVRSHSVTAFRYRIVYSVRGESIRIIAYAHSSRQPGYWVARVDS